MLDAVRLDGAKGLIDERAAQVSVVVRVGWLFCGSGPGGTNHTGIVAARVDIVNIAEYSDVNDVHIRGEGCYHSSFWRSRRCF